MKYHQRDIVEIDFPIPGEGYKIHPAVIVSNDELQVDEGFVYVALISSQDFATFLG
ncbi:MAG: type II toxin-antitoxin system PemK/MazF family toxin [Prevotella sp.]|nr:type II toxin-antitoxin system PemK/MazF family toxin [Prevotella sp.]MBR0275660.1 type II toxin-antitoxin system PemK/MazF family toxin [Prevotella sp.]